MKTLSLEEALPLIRAGKKVLDKDGDIMVIDHDGGIYPMSNDGFDFIHTDGYYIQPDPVEDAIERLFNSTTRTSGEIYSCAEAIRTAYLAEKAKWGKK